MMDGSGDSTRSDELSARIAELEATVAAQQVELAQRAVGPEGGTLTSRRGLLKGAGVVAGGLAALGAIGAATGEPAGAIEGQYAGSPTAFITLKVDGVIVKGGVTQKGFEGSIECIHFNQEVVIPNDGSDKRQYAPVVIRKPIDKATPLITRALAENRPVDAFVKFQSLGTTGILTTFFTVDMTGGRMLSQNWYAPDSELQGAGKTGRMLEELSFSFGPIIWTYVNGGITYQDEWSV